MLHKDWEDLCALPSCNMHDSSAAATSTLYVGGESRERRVCVQRINKHKTLVVRLALVLVEFNCVVQLCNMHIFSLCRMY